MFDFVLKNIRLTGETGDLVRDIGVKDGVIVAIEDQLHTDLEIIDCAGCLGVPGFVETHIHLDKACILDRCDSELGTLDEALSEVSRLKKEFTQTDIYSRARKTLEKSISQGTTWMRTHLEVDPVIGLKGIEAVLQLRNEFSWAIDIEICVFPQDGMLNYPGVEELMIEALKMGCQVIGGCPYTDSDPIAQIDRIFELASEFDVDIDFHLDFDIDPKGLTVGHVCKNATKYNWSGRTTIGHVSKLSALKPEALKEISAEMAAAGVALTALPSTDLFLMGSEFEYNIPRGVPSLQTLSENGVVCALSTNNVLNPFTPFGDCSMVRLANLYANIAQLGTTKSHRNCLDWITSKPAQLMRLKDYGIKIGNPADIVVLNHQSPEDVIREISIPLMGFKRGYKTFTRQPAQIHYPQ